MLYFHFCVWIQELKFLAPGLGIFITPVMRWIHISRTMMYKPLSLCYSYNFLHGNLLYIYNKNLCFFQDDGDDSDDDSTILPTDSMIICARTDDKIKSPINCLDVCQSFSRLFIYLLVQ